MDSQIRAKFSTIVYEIGGVTYLGSSQVEFSSSQDMLITSELCWVKTQLRHPHMPRHSQIRFKSWMITWSSARPFVLLFCFSIEVAIKQALTEDESGSRVIGNLAFWFPCLKLNRHQGSKEGIASEKEDPFSCHVSRERVLADGHMWKPARRVYNLKWGKPCYGEDSRSSALVKFRGIQQCWDKVRKGFGVLPNMRSGDSAKEDLAFAGLRLDFGLGITLLLGKQKIRLNNEQLP